MPKKILVVDDEMHNIRLVQVNLERAGYQVITACDGIEALEKATNEHPDMVVMDDCMPRLDGMGALKKLQADPTTVDLPVIMLLERADDGNIFRFWSAGTRSVLTKPFNPMELLVFVQRIFQQIEDEERGGKDPFAL